MIIENGVNKWYGTQRTLGFFDDRRKLRAGPLNVRRWIAHLPLTTTVNIIVTRTIRQKWRAPSIHFCDQEMLSQYSKTGLLVCCPPVSHLQPYLTEFQTRVVIPEFEFDRDSYEARDIYVISHP